MYSGVSVAQSTMLLPGVMASSTCGKTACDASSVESMQKVVAHFATTSCGVSTTTHVSGYADVSGSHLALLRFHKMRVFPPFRRFIAIPSPMIPTPTNPTGPREEDADDEREAILSLSKMMSK